MSEVMRLLMDAQEQVRRLAVHVDRANALLGKTTETEDKLRAECAELRMRWQGAEERAKALFNSRAEMNEANAAEVAKLREEVERLAKERDDHKAAFEAELAGAGVLRKRYGAREDETFEQFIGRLTSERDEATAHHEDMRIRMSRALTGEAGKPWSVLEEVAGASPAPRTLSEEEKRKVAVQMVDAYSKYAICVDGMAAAFSVAEKHLRPEPRTLTEADRERLLVRMRAAYAANEDGMRHALAVVEGELFSEPRTVTMEEARYRFGKASIAYQHRSENCDADLREFAAELGDWLSVRLPPDGE